MHRAERILGHIAPDVANNKAPSLSTSPTASNSDDDIVIVTALRTAIGRARKGKFANAFIEDMLAPIMKAVIDRTKIDPALIGDIVVGSVLGKNVQRANEARIAQFLAGIPNTVPVHVINRQCSSGLQAIAHVAANIKAGFYDVGLACGVESMSSARMGWDGPINPSIFLNQQAKDCLLPMGITSENVARKWKISREEQDQLAVNSHAKAARAIKTGRFKAEIVPVTVTVKGKDGSAKKVIMDTDEGCREGTTLQVLGKLRAVFQKGGSTTAGNASQVSDGAAAALVTTRRRARELGLPIQGVLRSFAVAGVPPSVMGIGPAYAIPMALKQAGLSKHDIDIYEINEAFASQATMCVKQLGLDMNKVNPNGGAIALGHPLGMTGVRMTATLLNEMEKQNKRYGIVSMCIGSGMGAAAVFERDM